MQTVHQNSDIFHCKKLCPCTGRQSLWCTLLFCPVPRVLTSPSLLIKPLIRLIDSEKCDRKWFQKRIPEPSVHIGLWPWTFHQASELCILLETSIGWNLYSRVNTKWKRLQKFDRRHLLQSAYVLHTTFVMTATAVSHWAKCTIRIRSISICSVDLAFSPGGNSCNCQTPRAVRASMTLQRPTQVNVTAVDQSDKPCFPCVCHSLWWGSLLFVFLVFTPFCVPWKTVFPEQRMK